ncbi:MAG: transposase [Pseudomonadales bacterium]|nr:transposase [Pseudomonadales bacterium]
MANWMIKCGKLIQPLINRIQYTLLEQPVLHMDETPVKVLREEGISAQSKSYMWVLASKFHRHLLYSASRSGNVPVSILGDYSGTLEGGQKICIDNELARLGCWEPARRKFVEAHRNQQKGNRARPM